MSAEAENQSAPAETKPEASEAPAEVVAPEATPAESTSKANEIAADAQPKVTETNGEPAMDTDASKPADTTVDASAENTVVAPETPASSKKSKDSAKRRSSAGIPEHRVKKVNPKKKGPELQLDAEPGDMFLADMKGFPKWPAIICDEDMLVEELLKNRPVTAKRPDGTYREDFEEGGKNVRDRTYAIMFLGTYEFSWMPNISLKPFSVDAARNANTNKMSKMLEVAYKEAAEGHDFATHKQHLAEHQEALAKLKEERESKKSKSSKKSKKAKDAGGKDDEDEDEEMADAEPPAPKSSSKKRKAADTADEAPKSGKKMKLNLSKGAQTPASEKKKTPKTKTPKTTEKSKPAEPQMSEAERRDKKKQGILYCRHKLQKAFLTSQTAPDEENIKSMAGFFDQLEKSNGDIDAGIIKETKIHKVMKAIVKLETIPQDDKFHFKDRAGKLFEEWSGVLGEPVEKIRPSTANGESKAADAAEAKVETKDEEKAEEKKDEAEAKAEEEKPNDDDKDEGGDTAMADADTTEKKDEKPADDSEVPKEDSEKADGETGEKAAAVAEAA